MRILESDFPTPDSDRDAQVSITALCLTMHSNEKSNWLITVNLTDTDAKIREALIDLSIVEAEDNGLRFKARTPDDTTDTIHYCRSVELAHSSQLAFVRAKIQYRKDGCQERICLNSPILVLVGSQSTKLEAH